VVALFDQKISEQVHDLIKNKFNTMKYEEIYTKHTTEAIWAAQADEIEWYSKPETICRKTKMDIHFVQRCELNICYLALDKHSRWIGDQIAFIYDSQ
jgi:propionyl-CoA synthetase